MPSSSPERRAGAHAPDLRTKLVWVTVFRTVATSLLLAVTAFRLFATRPDELSREDSLSFGLIAVVYLLTVIYAFWLRGRRVGTFAAAVQVGGDLLVATALLYVTGGPESPFAFTFLLAIVEAGILLDRRGVVVTTVCSCLLYAGLSFLIYENALRLPAGAVAVSRERLSFLLVSNALAQVLIASLIGYLSRQLRSTGGKLSEREEDLRRLVGLQEQILACMPSGLVTADATGRVTFINKAAESILGVRHAQTAEQRALDIGNLLPGALELSGQRRSELEVDTPQGRKSLGLTVNALEREAGSVLVVFQDLTELRRMEEEVRRVDRLASMGRLAAQLAHEVRNPLAAMRGSAQMLSEDLAEDPRQARLLRIVLRESDRLAGLVEDFLRFARPPPPSLQAWNLRELVEETVEMMRADPLAQNIRLETSLEDVPVRVDSGQLRQVLINMLRNAFVAVGAGGHVRVLVDGGDGRARIRVWDSGGGISQNELGRLFEPFYTTREGGTGLGLSTAHSIVRAHRGSIHVTSSPEKGTEFEVMLPIIEEEAARAHPGRG